MNTSAILREIESGLDETIAMRRQLHLHPEVGLDLPKTQALVLATLDGLGLEITLGKSSSSITAVLRGGLEGSAVLLRADMDALPVTELTDLPFASAVDGLMHACGHDLHTAMLVAAAKVLSKNRAELPGDVVFMFQPGEEGHDGARLMIEEGVLGAAGKPLAGAYGVHVMAGDYPSGIFMTRPGAMMAANDSAVVLVQGQGGHGSAPHLANDPIPAAAAMVSTIETLVTRKFDVFDPVVVTIGSINAGTQDNIIPEVARVALTVRSFTAAARQRVREEISRACEHIAVAHGVTAQVHYTQGYPATVNDPDHATWVGETLAATFGDSRFRTMRQPIAATEDFSRILQNVPGSYVFLGAGGPNGQFNHSPRVTFDESVLADGALMHVTLATGRLSAAAQEIEKALT